MHQNYRAAAPLLRDTVPMVPMSTDAWVGKARALSAETLPFAGSVADPASVAPCLSADSDDWPYGNFMLAWLDPAPSPRLVRHLPDAAFFLKLLARAYGPVLVARPDLAELLYDYSRPEMSLTNDVFQIQLRGLEDGYSMIRHHSLMLFYAALWLEEPRREGWLDLYDEIATYAENRPGGLPDLTQLAAIEQQAFDDFVRLAPLTLEAATAEALLQSDHELDRILDYQLYAAVAIGLLWREYRALPDSGRVAWQRRQLAELYRRPDYLNLEWSARA